MILANFIFVVLTFKNTPNCPFKYFESPGVIVVKKKSLPIFLFLFDLSLFNVKIFKDL